MDKLSGPEYIQHWDRRISRGPVEAGTVENGNDTWAFIRPHVSGFDPKSVLEYGCAYGRMLRHVHEQWPQAKLYGVDLCKTALDHLAANWPDKEAPTLFNRNTPPPNLHVDMIYTNTVLQHVTDPEILQKIADGFRKILNPGGNLVLFENVTFAHGGGGVHMLHFGSKDYMALWPELRWRDCGTFTHRHLVHGPQSHELMIGTRP